VYAAWDQRLEREVAIKAIRHDLLPTPRLIERFEQEAKAVARLQHPNILTIHSVVDHAGITCMVMPRVRGESLRSLLDREGPLPWEEAFRIAAETADGLHAAHEAGLIHRDVKPENILLEGQDRRALLSDFGIAKAVHEQMEEDHAAGGGASGALTAATQLLGTPHYVSPEQAAGEGAIGPQADIYSLGCVLYEMMTGAPPFQAKSVEALIARHLTDRPRPLAEVVPEISWEADAAVDMALQKDPAARLSTARQFALALRTFGVPSLRSPLLAEPGRDRHRERLTLYLVLSLLLVAGAFLLRDNPLWGTGAAVHTIIEVTAILMAAMIGALALVRYYTFKQATFLFLGTGFLGAGLLDLYHALMTSDYFVAARPGYDPQDLFAWTWIAGRVFLALFLAVSVLAWRKEAQAKVTKGGINEASIFLTSLALTIINLFFFEFVPLSRSHFPALPISRPAEFLPALFFSIALLGFFVKGSWRRDAIDHWLLISLVISIALHALFMSQSDQRFDAMFDAAHLLKVLSYAALLVGLLADLFVTFGSRGLDVLE